MKKRMILALGALALLMATQPGWAYDSSQHGGGDNPHGGSPHGDNPHMGSPHGDAANPHGGNPHGGDSYGKGQHPGGKKGGGGHHYYRQSGPPKDIPAHIRSRTSEDGQGLNLNNSQVGLKGAEFLATAPDFSEVRSLALKTNKIGDAGLKLLCDSENFRKVEKLSLWDKIGRAHV